MRFDEDSVLAQLVRIVCRLESNETERKDLHQLGLIFLWLVAGSHPGNTTSWYLTGCKRHLADHQASGRSIDSPKRRHLGCPMEDESTDAEPAAVDLAFIAAASTLDEVCHRDLIREICRRLDGMNR